MKSDIEIARDSKIQPITEIASALGIQLKHLKPYGHFMGKLDLKLINPEKIKRAKLILVTAMTPNKAGVGKTTTAIGLSLGLNNIGKQTVVALREPSLGPCFGMKGGATGGGFAQVLPMEEINLHFTGDFHAITCAHNMIAALLDNYQYQNQGTAEFLTEVVWGRVLDVNDRNLRKVITGLGSKANGVTTESGFDITPASEIMATLCLASNLEDLRKRIDGIILGYKQSREVFRVKDLAIGGAIIALLKNAIEPNLVQTTENTPAIIHGGPFANIAHGCNSLIATKMAMSLGDYVVTEAGFGSDLGAEKFLNIKCRIGGLKPDATVLVISSQALKLHGEVAETDIQKPNLEGFKKGLENLKQHIKALKSLGQRIVISFNQYHFDVEEEIEFLQQWCLEQDVSMAIDQSFAKGGEGGRALAEVVARIAEGENSSPLKLSYADEDSTESKLNKVVQKIYGGKGVRLSKRAQLQLKKIERLKLTHLPVCIAKTQYAFSDDQSNPGLEGDFYINIRELIINEGPGFIVAVAGEIMRMPGLPKKPQALEIDVVDGFITGLM